jgi:hypothetical protein
VSWSKDLQRLTNKGRHDMAALAKALKVEAFSGIVLDTRVDTGRLRGNWQIQENTPATGEIERLDKTGETVTREVAEKASAKGLTYFVNNLPYAVVYEEEDGMVKSNLARIKANVKRLARKVKG